MTTTTALFARRLAQLVAGVLAAALIPIGSAAAQPAGAPAWTGDAAAQAEAVRAWRGPLPDGADGVWAGDDVVPGSVLVTTSAGADLRTFADAGWTTTSLGGGVTEVRVAPGDVDQVVADLQGHPDVRSVEPNRIREFTAVPDDPRYAEQWAHQITGAEGAWEVTTGSTDVVVAIADSGIVATHPDLAGIVEQVDASSGTVRPGGPDNDPCRVGHGTWVAGVLGAVGDNATGVAGTAWTSRIIDINTADPAVSCSGPTDAGTIAAITYAAERGADVVNLSLGGRDTSCPAAMQQAVDTALAAGTVVVAASGNGGDTLPQVPGACNGVISVGAVGPDGQVAPYSTRNPHVDVVGPGGAGGPTPSAATEVLTTSWWSRGQRTPEYTAVAGTSFAVPYVSGLAALIRSVAPDTSPVQVEALLEQTAVDVGEVGRDDASGWGLVQGAAVIAAADGTDPGEPAADPDFPVGLPPGPNRPGGDVPVVRVSDGRVPTTPMGQAVAVSRSLFADADQGGIDQGGAGRIAASWAVVARDDAYADALAGSSLTFGAAPLLFTTSDGPLDMGAAAELDRTLPDGATVYLLGGTAALPSTLEAEVRALGLEPVRLAGPVREATAVAVADEVDRLLTEVVGTGPSRTAVLVDRESWPDAVAAGLLGAQMGAPILLTPSEGLSETTAAALAARDLSQLLVVGGIVRVPKTTAAEAADAARVPSAVRLAGEERNGTVVAVSGAAEDLLAGLPGGGARTALAVNVRRGDAWAHLLSATVPASASAGLFVPVEGEGGTVLADVATAYARGLGLPLYLMGGPDLVADSTGTALEAVVEEPPAG